MLDMEWVQELDQAIGVSARLVLALHIEMLSLRVPVVALKSGHVRRTAQKSVLGALFGVDSEMWREGPWP